MTKRNQPVDSKPKKRQALILIDKPELMAVDDGIHYYPIPNHDPETLTRIENSLYEILHRITGFDFRCRYRTVGSWGKKRPGDYHKDLDLITDLNESEIATMLANLPYEPIFYKGLSTWTFVIKDLLGVPRKIDIFQCENVDFSENAYHNVSYNETEWPSWARNMILNSICKIKIKDDNGWTGRFIPYRGLCIYDNAPKNKQSRILTTSWSTMKQLIGFDKVDRLEDILITIRENWIVEEKADLIKLISEDRKLVNLLEKNNKSVADIADEIY